MAAFQHPLEILSSQAHAAHDVDLEHLLPGSIRFIKKPDCFVDAQIVHQDIDLWPSREGCGASPGGAVISRQADQVSAGQVPAEFCQCFLDVGLRAAVDDDSRPLDGQGTGDFKPDASG